MGLHFSAVMTNHPFLPSVELSLFLIAIFSDYRTGHALPSHPDSLFSQGGRSLPHRQADALTMLRRPAVLRMRTWRCLTCTSPSSTKREKVRLTVSSFRPR